MGLDDGAQHPAGSAFDEARNEREAWRRQQIVALTPAQRTEYEALKQEHDRRIEDRRAELQTGERERKIERTRHHLRSNPAPALAPGREAGAENRDSQRAHDAVPDYVDGKMTAETKALESRLRPAYLQAESDVAREQAEALRPLQAQLQTGHDNFLAACERQRQPEEKSIGDSGKTKQRAGEDNQSWREAVLKAARQEAQQSRDHNLTRDFNRKL